MGQVNIFSPSTPASEYKRDRTGQYAAGCVLLCAIAIGAAATLPWLHVASPVSSSTLTGAELPPLLCAVLALTAFTVVATLAHKPEPARWAAVAALLLTVAIALLIAVVEVAASAVPREMLPVTVRRANVELTAGYGLWLVVTSATAMAIACACSLGVAGRGLIRRAGASPARAVAFCGLLLSVVVLGVLRYDEWIVAGAAAQGLGLEGWATPWVGPLSLVALWALVAAFVLALAERRVGAAMLAGAAGWLVALSAALTILAGGTLAELHLDELAPAELRAYAPSFQVGASAWLAYGVGLLAAVAGMGLLLRDPAKGRLG